MPDQNVSSTETLTPAPIDQTSEITEESGTTETDVTAQSDEILDGEEGETGTTEGKKPKVGFERRVSKLTAQKAEAQREVEYWKKIALEAKGQQPAAVGEVKPEDKKPTFIDYNDIEAYSEAVATWTAERAVQKALANQDADRGSRTVLSDYETRLTAFKKITPDFDEVFEDLNGIQLAPEVMNGVLESEIGPQLAYYLATNLNVVQRLNSLSPHKRLIELGKLEAQLEQPRTEPESTKKASSAPAPLKTPTGGVQPRKLDSTLSPDEWIRERNKQERARRR